MDIILADKELADTRSFIQQVAIRDLPKPIQNQLAKLYQSLTVKNAKKIRKVAQYILRKHYEAEREPFSTFLTRVGCFLTTLGFGCLVFLYAGMYFYEYSGDLIELTFWTGTFFLLLVSCQLL